MDCRHAPLAASTNTPLHGGPIIPDPSSSCIMHTPPPALFAILPIDCRRCMCVGRLRTPCASRHRSRLCSHYDIRSALFRSAAVFRCRVLFRPVLFCHVPFCRIQSLLSVGPVAVSSRSCMHSSLSPVHHRQLAFDCTMYSRYPLYLSPLPLLFPVLVYRLMHSCIPLCDVLCMVSDIYPVAFPSVLSMCVQQCSSPANITIPRSHGTLL